MFNMPCVIFAGGKSSRMGKDKALLPFGRYPTLTQYQYERLQNLFNKIYISTKDSSKFDFDARFIDDETTSDTFAPTAGFVSVFNKLNDNKFFALSVDTPFVDLHVIDKLIKSDSDDYDATVAKSRSGLHPMCGIYHRSLEKSFKSMLANENHKLGMLLKESNTQVITFEHEEPFTNLNHPHEYQEALLKEIEIKKGIYEFNSLR